MLASIRLLLTFKWKCKYWMRCNHADMKMSHIKTHLHFHSTVYVCGCWICLSSNILYICRIFENILLGNVRLSCPQRFFNHLLSAAFHINKRLAIADHLPYIDAVVIEEPFIKINDSTLLTKMKPFLWFDWTENAQKNNLRFWVKRTRSFVVF